MTQHKELEMPAEAHYIIAAPSNPGYVETRRLGKFVTKMCDANRKVAVVVSATGANRSGTTVWTTQWNRRKANPSFRELCCCVFRQGQGPHHRLHVMTTPEEQWPECREVPGPKPGREGKIKAIMKYLEHRLKGLAPAKDQPSYLFQPDNAIAPQCPEPGEGKDDPRKCSSQQETPLCTDMYRSVQSAFPTEQREQAKKRKDKLKAEGKEVVVKKRVKVVEDHYDDCGDDITSLQDTDQQVKSSANLSVRIPQECDLEEVFEDDIDHHHAYPVIQTLDERKAQAELKRIDPATISQPQLGEPREQPDAAAVEAAANNAGATGRRKPLCKACRASRTRSDWEHNRVIGECYYPYDKPYLPRCIACQLRLKGTDELHGYLEDDCLVLMGLRKSIGDVNRKPLQSRAPEGPAPGPKEPDPTGTGEPMTFEDREDLGAGAENRLMEADKETGYENPSTREDDRETGGSSSSRNPLRPRPDEGRGWAS